MKEEENIYEKAFKFLVNLEIETLEDLKVWVYLSSNLLKLIQKEKWLYNSKTVLSFLEDELYQKNIKLNDSNRLQYVEAYKQRIKNL